jgi:hypothetical protein
MIRLLLISRKGYFMRKFYLLSFLFMALLICGIDRSFAQWSADPSKNTPVDTGGHSPSDVVMLKDGNGGAFIVWDDERAASGIPKIFAQHLDKNGNALWTANGLEICPGGADQVLPQVAVVGDGGIIISWEEDNRDSIPVFGGTSPAIFAQRISSHGARLWRDSALQIAGPLPFQLFYPQGIPTSCVSDGNGGAYVSWADLNYGLQDLIVTRIDSSGNVRWSSSAQNGFNGNGLPIGGYTHLRLLQNGTAGVIIAWTDVRNAFTTGISLFAQKLDSAGARLWDTMGVALAPKPQYLQQQTNEVIVSDNAGGAIYAWEQSASGSSPHGYAGHVSTSGQLTWISATDSLGTLVDSKASTGQENLSMISGGNGTALLTWTDGANYAYVQKIASDGSLPWGSNPTSIAANTSGEVLTTDGSGGVIVAWGQGLQNGVNIFAQRVNSSGQTVWSNPTYGTFGNPVSTTPSAFQGSPLIVPDDAGGAIIAWHDQRPFSYGGPYDIYAHHIGSNGVTKVIQQITGLPREFSLSQNYPNPFNPSTQIQFSIAQAGFVTLKVYDLLGREVTTLVHQNLTPSSYSVTWNASNVASGAYFYRLQSGSYVETRKLLLMK